MLTIPLQAAPVPRDSPAHRHAGACEVPASAFGASAGVHASQSVCDNLTGFAASLCYASEYGVSV